MSYKRRVMGDDNSVSKSVWGLFDRVSASHRAFGHFERCHCRRLVVWGSCHVQMQEHSSSHERRYLLRQPDGRILPFEYAAQEPWILEAGWRWFAQRKERVAKLPSQLRTLQLQMGDVFAAAAQCGNLFELFIANALHARRGKPLCSLRGFATPAGSVPPFYGAVSLPESGREHPEIQWLTNMSLLFSGDVAPTIGTFYLLELAAGPDMLCFLDNNVVLTCCFPLEKPRTLTDYRLAARKANLACSYESQKRKPLYVQRAVLVKENLKKLKFVRLEIKFSSPPAEPAEPSETCDGDNAVVVVVTPDNTDLFTGEMMEFLRRTIL